MNTWLDHFAQELRAPTAGSGLDLRVYRNNIALAEREALRANFPTVHQLMGDAAFDALGALHLQAQPPSQPNLLHLGQDFPAWLAQLLTQQPEHLPLYLPAVAQLDRGWTLAHCACDAPAIELDELEAVMSAQSLVQAHPAAQSFFFDDMPAAQIFLQSRAGVTDFSDLTWQGGGALFTRPGQHVQLSACSTAAHQLLTQLHTACPLAQALASAGDAQTAGLALFELISQGALTVARPIFES